MQVQCDNVTFKDPDKAKIHIYELIYVVQVQSTDLDEHQGIAPR